MEKNILIIAGEPSGDVRAAEMLKEFRALDADTRIWGIGGDRMAAQGMELVRHIRELSIIGVWEAVKRLGEVRRHYRELTRLVDERGPEMAVLVDYPGFNLKMASFLHKKNIPIIYYIIPQVWAWGRGRIRALDRFVDKALVLFPFEEELLRSEGVNSEFVGHPVVDMFGDVAPSAEENPGPTRIALLSGSRKSEIENMLPVMLETCTLIKKEFPEASFVLAESSNVPDGIYDRLLSEHPGINTGRIKDDTKKCLTGADLALVTSGTATLETAMMGVPMVVSYKASRLTYILFRVFSRLEHIGLVNIVAGKEVAPELLQDNATAGNMARAAVSILKDPGRIAGIKEDLCGVRKTLGEGGAARKAARAVKKSLDGIRER